MIATLVIDNIKKDIILDCILYIYYLVNFPKICNNFKALINSGSEFNIIAFTFALQLGS